MQQRCSRKRAALPRCDFEAPQETSCSIARHTVHVVLEAATPLPPFRCRPGRVGRRRSEDSYGRVWDLRRLGAIGRESCGESVRLYLSIRGIAVALKKKTKKH